MNWMFIIFTLLLVANNHHQLTPTVIYYLYIYFVLWSIMVMLLGIMTARDVVDLNELSVVAVVFVVHAVINMLRKKGRVVSLVGGGLRSLNVSVRYGRIMP